MPRRAAKVLEETPEGVFSLALDPAFAVPDDEASTRILDAAVAIAGSRGAAAITMDAVSEEAGVGRMTVYRRFGSAGELVRALLVRETRAALTRISEALDPGASVAERMADGFVATLREARAHPLLAHADPAAIARSLNDPADRTGELMRAFLTALIADGVAKGEMREIDPGAAAELLFRIGISFVLVRESGIDTADEAAARAFARELIAPILESR